MSPLTATFILAMAACLGMLAGASFAVWLWLESLGKHQHYAAKRALDREIVMHEIDSAAAKRALARLRAQRTELLALLEAARSGPGDSAREQQIRRQAADSEFGEL